jgi:hypothetical protein
MIGIHKKNEVVVQLDVDEVKQCISPKFDKGLKDITGKLATVIQFFSNLGSMARAECYRIKHGITDRVWINNKKIVDSVKQDIQGFSTLSEEKKGPFDIKGIKEVCQVLKDNGVEESAGMQSMVDTLPNYSPLNM